MYYSVHYVLDTLCCSVNAIDRTWFISPSSLEALGSRDLYPVVVSASSGGTNH
jgi:hypothetical protein